MRKAHVKIEFDVYSPIPKKAYKKLSNSLDLKSRFRTALNYVQVRKDNIKIEVTED